MYFKKIYMHGFKSFADPVTIEFNDGITCVVGPNGSGKSNISDALRWVLGEQSPKALRGGKMDEVIFAGTASRKSRGMAEVTLTIDNSTGILPIDYSEVAITRRMFRSGESEYLINNNQCRLRDIRELIMDTGIGVDGYSIIGQGKIADIVSNKPESRREIFEEAAGIVMYRTRKADVEKKLNASAQNLDRVNDIVSEIEGRIDTLREDSIKATEYIGLRDRYKELEINITLKNIENVELKNEYLKDDITEAGIAIDELKEEKVAIDKSNNDLRLRQESLDTLERENNDKLLALVDEINEIVNRTSVNKERLASIDENRERLYTEIEGLKERLAREEKESEGLLESKKEIDDKLEDLEVELNDRLSKYADQTAKMGRDSEDIDEKKNAIFELTAKSQSKRAEAVSLESLRNTLEERRQQLQNEADSASDSRQQAEKAKQAAEAEKRDLSSQLGTKRQEAQKLSEEYNNSLMQERETTKALEDLRIRIGQMNGRRHTLEEMENSYEGYNQAVRFIMKEHASGIEGVVAELMTVPAGFETAIETALGASLQNIVCTDDRAAQSAINMLKENRAGRLTFLPIASIRGGYSKDPGATSAKGFKGYGVDCIDFDDKYRNIFEYLLGRTVVVDNMDSAIALSKKRISGLRIVTLEGEIINAGGAITGGKYKNNTAQLLTRKSEIAKLGEDIENAERDKRAKESELSKTKAFLDSAAKNISALNEEARAIEMDLVLCTSKLEVAESVLQDMAREEEQRTSELARIKGEAEKSGDMISALLAQADEDEKTIEKLSSESEELLLAYERKRSEMEEINEEIVAARMKVTAAREQQNSADSIVSRIMATISEIKSDIDQKTKERENLLAQKNEITASATDGSVSLSDLTEQRERTEQYKNELAQEKASVSEELTKSQKKKDEIDENLANLTTSKMEMEIKQARNETQLDNYKEKLWEDFEVSYVQAIEFRKTDFQMAPAQKESREIRNRIKELGEVNVGAIKEYEQVKERYEFLVEQRDDIQKATDELQGIIDEMDRTIRMKFKESFDAVVQNFEVIFKELFGGGHAELRLEDENNPLETGIEIIAQPPGKKLQNINLMSGGEKTMTAIALMFAVLKTKPTPFCIMDEVEAALDDANIDRFANYLKNFEEIQFTLVTHQKATMEHADVLYGVTMPEQGVSKLLSLKLGDEFEI